MSEPPPPRAIAQIAVSPGDVLYALASDGTLWRLAVHLGYGWAQLPGIPVDELPPLSSSTRSNPI